MKKTPWALGPFSIWRVVFGDKPPNFGGEYFVETSFELRVLFCSFSGDFFGFAAVMVSGKGMCFVFRNPDGAGGVSFFRFAAEVRGVPGGSAGGSLGPARLCGRRAGPRAGRPSLVGRAVLRAFRFPTQKARRDLEPALTFTFVVCLSVFVVVVFWGGEIEPKGKPEDRRFPGPSFWHKEAKPDLSHILGVLFGVCNTH